MSDAALCALILVATLGLFVSERVRHDLVALLALFACLLLGLVPIDEAFVGLADPAVVAVAAILVVGRAVELSGVAAFAARCLLPARAPFAFRLAMLLALGAALSAFMNNIAALVITMPLAAEVARDARRSPTATLMPLAFATILGGMTTLIGTPANLILSSVREQQLGAPFGFFTMTPVGCVVVVAGLAYLALIGWRLLPVREATERARKRPWRVFELDADAPVAVADLLPRLRAAGARLLATHRDGAPGSAGLVDAGDRLLLLARRNQWEVAEDLGLRPTMHHRDEDRAVTTRFVVGYGSDLIGLSHAAIAIRSEGALAVAAAGPRAARERQPLGRLRIAAGDQLFIRGVPERLAELASVSRLLEIDRFDPQPVPPRRAVLTMAIFIASILAIVIGGISPAIAFLGAAVAITAARLLPAKEVYRSIDWSIIVLLAAMIPVGRSFETSGAAAIAAQMIGQVLAGMPLVGVLAVLCGLTLLLSIFLNNVATAIIIGPLALDAATLLGIPPDAALLAVLIGASSDFLTPIGHQNNLLVMGPGGYRFLDYARMGAPLVVIVVAAAAITLSLLYG
ncbi:di/tricarboxylate transporter [Sphingomonas zeicaulis]|uniref:SLC13 family permease n=1 Tax=Sphingomonas zeicaulis TaxID=1632740 RepID=UPI003D21D016